MVIGFLPKLADFVDRQAGAIEGFVPLAPDSLLSLREETNSDLIEHSYVSKNFTLQAQAFLARSLLGEISSLLWMTSRPDFSELLGMAKEHRVTPQQVMY